MADREAYNRQNESFKQMIAVFGEFKEDFVYLLSEILVGEDGNQVLKHFSAKL